MTDGEITARMFAKIDKQSNGCWLWTAAMTGGPAGNAVLNAGQRGEQRCISVRRWLWQKAHGYPAPGPQQHCAHSWRCVNPAHNPPKADLQALVHAQQAIRGGASLSAAGVDYRVSRAVLQRFLTPDDWAAHHQSRERASFWGHIEYKGEHWLWTHTTRTVWHEGRWCQAKQKAWWLSGRTLAPDVVLYVACEEPTCIRPEHQREQQAPAARVAKEKRGPRVRMRNARMVELVTRYGWTNQKVARLFMCSVALVQHALDQAHAPARQVARGARSGTARRVPRTPVRAQFGTCVVIDVAELAWEWRQTHRGT